MSGSFLKNKWTSCLYILFSWSWVRTHAHIGFGFEPVRWQNHKLQIYKLNIFSQDKTEGKHVWGPSSNDSIMTSLVPWSTRKKIHQNQSRSLSQNDFRGTSWTRIPVIAWWSANSLATSFTWALAVHEAMLADLGLGWWFRNTQIDCICTCI